MEFLLHYVWQHRLFGTAPLRTVQGESVEVIDTGLHNLTASGPDFFNAKIKIGGVLWAGNVEIHEKSSDWYLHKHERDHAYNNVILHVASELDAEVRTEDGKVLPQLQLKVPENLLAHYRELIDEQTYPPCYRIIPEVSELTVHAWMNRLTVERLEQKTDRIRQYLEQTGGDWERAFFMTLARNFGFGTNADIFERWAATILPGEVGKHRDNEFQVEAFFMGQAGLLSPEHVAPERQDDYFRQLCSEYAFLRHKFNLQPIDGRAWKFGRLRPQNSPLIRLSQLARFYGNRQADFSHLIEVTDFKELRRLFQVGVTPYWKTHYHFGEASRSSDKVLRQSSLDLILINSVAPLLFAYGRHLQNESLCERATAILEALPAESNYITRCWERAGISVSTAADSQALIHLRKHYCDTKNCLRCRFGAEYLKNRK